MGKRKGYGQFCPVAKAAEVVAERWTPLVIRELLLGSHRFGELRKGVPLMSPSLLSQRLGQLQDAGVVERRRATRGGGYEYHLTEAGRQLQDIIERLGIWGHRHVQRQVAAHDLDPSLLMWDVRRGIDPNAVTEDGRVVVQLELADVPSACRRWWLVVDRGQADLCVTHPGYDVDLHVRASIRTLVEVWLGKTPVRSALRAGAIELEGPRSHVRAFPRWFSVSPFVALERADRETARA